MKKIVFYLFLALLVLPVIQKEYTLITPMRLNGSFKPAKNIAFASKEWFSAKYQSSKEKYIKENIGFRSCIVMAYNQLLYSCFDLANNPGGVVGEDNYLYLESYIFNETGENYIGDKKVDEISDRLYFLQEFYADKGVDLITVFLPSKASFYPEFIPSQYQDFPKSNYEAFCESFESRGIQYLDLNKYFLAIKGEAPYPIFSKNGIHWTHYGMALGMDSLLRKIEQMRGIDLPDFSWKEPVSMEDMKDPTDHDAENLMNLIFEMPRAQMPYTDLVFGSDSLKTKAKTLVISDSYYWKAYKQRIPHHIFDWGGFWYYFNTARQAPDNKESVAEVKDLDVVNVLKEQDVIVLFASQATLHIFPYGFDEKMFPLLLPEDSIAFYQYLKNNILDDFNKLERVKQKAKSMGHSFEEQLLLQLEMDKDKFIQSNNPELLAINKIILKIKNDPKWMAAIVKKAKARNLSTDEMIQKDAQWLYKQKQKQK